MNVDGFLNIIVAAKKTGVRRLVYASSSSVYGDSTESSKREDIIGNPLSPYAVTKRTDELYARALSSAAGLTTVGLRYFNVFGPRQDPDGPYAAVIPCWLSRLLSGQSCVIYGDGKTSRDFCYVENVVQANILAATTPDLVCEIFNVACGESITLNELYSEIKMNLHSITKHTHLPEIEYQDFRQGDIRHSLANIDKAGNILGYAPLVDVQEGLREYVEWYAAKSGLIVRDYLINENHDSAETAGA